MSNVTYKNFDWYKSCTSELKAGVDNVAMSAIGHGYFDIRSNAYIATPSQIFALTKAYSYSYKDKAGTDRIGYIPESCLHKDIARDTYGNVIYCPAVLGTVEPKYTYWYWLNGYHHDVSEQEMLNMKSAYYVAVFDINGNSLSKSNISRGYSDFKDAEYYFRTLQTMHP